jgi:hypothetical protein
MVKNMLSGTINRFRKSVAPRPIWSIGIFTGDSPLKLASREGCSGPVLSPSDISDVPAEFVADPFIVRARSEWLMFFEIMSAETGRGEIGLAKSTDGLCWQYQSSVLRESFHLSYPLVFEWQGNYFMVPETLGQNAIVLYQALRFPYEWKPIAKLVKGTFADATLFWFEEMWWMFACSTPYRHDALRLYYSRDLTGEWVEHKLSPIIRRNRRTARPGGRVVSFDGKVIRYAQDCAPYYGHRLRAFEITCLSPTHYAERECAESPILSPGAEWNAAGMHHVDPHLLDSGIWLASVDGHRFEYPKDSQNRPFSNWLGSRLLRR